MRFSASLAVAIAALCSSLPTSTRAHTSLAKPTSREGGQATVGDELNAIGCAGQYAPVNPPTAVKAGEELPVSYWRNNHIGGFVRWSIIKKGTPETVESFDQNVFLYTCQESGSDCNPRNGKPYSLYKESWDGSPVFSIPCGDKITIPDYLEDGDYVLQYTNFATGHSEGNPGKTTPMYRSCADLSVSGGSTSNKKPACPAFVGGDRGTRNENKGDDKCAYYISNAYPSVMATESDPAKIEANYQFGAPADWEKCTKENPTVEAPAPTEAPAPAATEAPAPEPTPAPTEAPAPEPTEAPAPEVTPEPAPAPTTAPTTAPKLASTPAPKPVVTVAPPAATKPTSPLGTVKPDPKMPTLSSTKKPKKVVFMDKHGNVMTNDEAAAAANDDEEEEDEEEEEEDGEYEYDDGYYDEEDEDFDVDYDE